MQAVTKFISIVKTLNEKVGKAASYLLFIFMLLMVFEVISRYFFKNPTIWVHELCGQFFAAYIALTGGWVLLQQSHVAVDIVYQFFPDSFKRLSDIVVSLLGLFMFGVLFWQGYKFAWHALISQQHSHTLFGPPMWPVKMMIPAGALLFLLQLLADLAQSIIDLKGRSVK